MATTKVITELTDLNQANSESGLRMPTGGVFSGTPAEGMMRNDTTQDSEGSASTMQHYNGTDWKNFVNTAQCTTTNCDYPVTGSILYQFEDNANNTCSGGTYDATAGTNVSYSASGKYGKAAEFTASTASAADVITVPDAVANLIINNFTISFWMKPDNLNYAGSGYVNPVGLQKGRRFYIDINSSGSITSFNGSTILASSNSVITTGSWFNVVYTQSSSTGRVLYVNKVSVANDGTTSDTTSYNPGGSENIIGGYKSSSAWGLMFDGLIDQFRLFPSVLGQADVDKLYNEIPC
tara:strand:- start:54 stop:935 length:882 start_codon:yes stop_codon:yes gene_type:complete